MSEFKRGQEKVVSASMPARPISVPNSPPPASGRQPKTMTPKQEEDLRCKLAVAILRSGYDEFAEESEVELTEWHECYEQPNCHIRNGLGACPCAGVPFLSVKVWEQIKPLLEELMTHE